ncbi:MAG: hypothetical protein Rpha_0856 [Candidatus Ruthia sp. Apha_13_S6]|nr:hypothetical protein [Candidatus Ruthia sp. Apha_13_S6]
MQVKYNKQFLKELAKLPNKTSTKIEKFVFESLPKCSTIEQVGNIEKMIGYKNCFKVSVGIKRKNEYIVVATVKHRGGNL